MVLYETFMPSNVLQQFYDSLIVQINSNVAVGKGPHSHSTEKIKPDQLNLSVIDFCLKFENLDRQYVITKHVNEY